MSFFTRPLTILDATVGDGQFRVEGMGGEVNPADNTASIAVNLTGAPPDPAPTTSVSSPNEGAPGNGGGSDLPTTGAHTALTAAAGATILAIGAALLLLSRRRRITVQTPADH
jgi:LPXTG-motif cell wall-anchored protein